MADYELTFEHVKTYATRDNARKAFVKRFPEIRFIIVQSEDGRYFPVAVGQEALTRQTFVHFATVA